MELRDRLSDLLDELEEDAVEDYRGSPGFERDALDYARSQGWSAPEDSEED